jgi:hypothetical protein
VRRGHLRGRRWPPGLRRGIKSFFLERLKLNPRP